MRITRHHLVPSLLFAAVACSGVESTLTDPAVTTSDTASSAPLGARRVFPADNPWNLDISTQPVDPASATLIAACGNVNLHPDFGTTYQGAPNGIPYLVVSGTQARVPVTFTYANESDPGPYPVPPDAP